MTLPAVPAVLVTPGDSMSQQTLGDIWQSPAEAVGDLLIEKGFEKAAPALSQVPLLSFIVAAYKSKGAVSDYLLARKVQQFYTAWELLPKADRQSVYRKFQKKPQDFIEKLLFILERQEDLEKCQTLGVLTTQYLKGELKRAEYYDFIETVSHLSIGDLRRLAVLAEKSLILAEKEVGERYAVLFVTRGLMATELPLPEEQRVEELHVFYRITPLGLKLVTCMKEQA